MQSCLTLNSKYKTELIWWWFILEESLLYDIILLIDLNKLRFWNIQNLSRYFLYLPYLTFYWKKVKNLLIILYFAKFLKALERKNVYWFQFYSCIPICASLVKLSACLLLTDFNQTFAHVQLKYFSKITCSISFFIVFIGQFFRCYGGDCYEEIIVGILY